MIIYVSEFTKTPGSRYRVDGLHSGQEFFEDILFPVIESCKNEIIFINFDGVIGYPTGFLSESFGLLVDNYGFEYFITHIGFFSTEEPGLIDEIFYYVKERIDQTSDKQLNKGVNDEK